MNIKSAFLTAGIGAFMSAGTASAAFISDTTPTPSVIGSITAGSTYTITATGVSDLFASFNNGKGAPFTADGKPTYAIPAPYDAFFPNGLDYDPSQNTSAHGIGGPGKLYGALLGTLTLTPTASDFFVIGLGTTFTATTTGTLYGAVNDCANCYFDNSSTGGYTVSLTIQSGPSTVPLPASAPLFGAALLALSAVGYGLKRKQAAAA